MHGHDTNGPYNNASCNANYTIANGGWSNPDNNFGPGETGTITPRAANAGWWRGTVPWANPGNGRVTVGNTNNIVVNAANAPSVGESKSSSHCSASGSSYIYAPSAPSVPDGSGAVHIGPSVPASAYTAATHITVNAGSSSASPWELECFQFLDNPWYYYYYTLTAHANACHTSCQYYSGGHWNTDHVYWPSVEYTSTISTQGGFVPA